MRIDNNHNNVTFNAYFKNNSAFKKVFSENLVGCIDKSLLDKFVNAPNHELEIINTGVSKYTSSNNYVLFNNTTGLSREIIIKLEETRDSLNIFLKNGIELCDEHLTMTRKKYIELYEKLTKH